MLPLQQQQQQQHLKGFIENWMWFQKLNCFQLKSEWFAQSQTSFSFQLEMWYEGMNKLFHAIHHNRKKGRIKITLLPFCNFLKCWIINVLLLPSMPTCHLSNLVRLFTTFFFSFSLLCIQANFQVISNADTVAQLRDVNKNLLESWQFSNGFPS